MSKTLVAILALSSLMLTAIPIAPVKAQGTGHIFTVGSCGPTTYYYWDMVNYLAGRGDYYRYNALESIYIWPYDTPDGSLDNLIPVLATDWDPHYRANETTDAGFMAYEGIDYIDIVLRENVKFHDGSDWNASVFKWNIDRLFYILGDFDDCLPDIPTSYLDPNYVNRLVVDAQKNVYWLDIDEWVKYATASWNVSDYTPGEYADFGISQDSDLNGTNGNYFPRIRNVTITDDAASGGEVRVYFNDWGAGPNSLASILMISQAAYKDKFDEPINGYHAGDLIGTGPYVFVDHDMFQNEGTMTRFADWWNSTAQQADGWHQIETVAVRTYGHDETGYAARAEALLEGEIDYLVDREWEPIPSYSTIATAPGVSYVDMGVEPYGEQLVLNCVNETYLRYWYELGMNCSGMEMPSSIVNTNGLLKECNGLNRALRKAISYAYDYDYYVTYGKLDRVVRSGGLLGVSNEFYDETIPLAYQNLTIARQALLDDPYWGALCADRLLDINNDTSDWEAVAADNPLYTLQYTYDAAHTASYTTFANSLPLIGIAISAVNSAPSNVFTLVSQGVFEFLKNDAFPIASYHSKINDIGYIEAYLKSPEIIERHPLNDSSYAFIADYPYDDPDGPYNYSLIPSTTFNSVARSNYGFSYNKTSNDLIAQIYFQNETGRETLYHELAEWVQDYQYPALYLGNGKTGFAISDDYESEWLSWLFIFSFSQVKYIGGGSVTTPAIIPGFELGVLLPVMLLSLAGIAFILLKRKRMAFN
ncbi:MAG: hypothetical protein JW891_18350 [Candidatus Lokiarchaeota archaeon]|nr:hypothetical protein [Candidatus Lokiarchaeota archaeon]